MLSLMKVGGRGMSIVPDGVLFGGDKAHMSLRKELIDNQKLIGVVSMPDGLFSAPTKKGSASKGANVKTSFLIFEKTNKCRTDYVWFYDMKNDGYTLDAKRTPVAGSDIPDIIDRYNDLEKEMTRKRTEQSFMIPVEEIRKNGYDLTIKRYQKYERIKMKYRETKDLMAEIKVSVDLSKCLMEKIKECL